MAVRGQPRRNALPLLRSALAPPGIEPTPPPPTVYVFDQFVAPNGTLLPAHAISPTNTPATAWSMLSGTAEIQSNAVHGLTTGLAGRTLFVCDPAVSDFTLSADIKMAASGYASLIWRVVDSGNHWDVRLTADSSFIYLIKWIGGGSAIMDAVAFVFIAGQTYHVEVTATGPAVAVLIDGSPAVAASDPGYQTQTVAGGGMDGGSLDCTVTNWKMQP